MTPKIKAGPRTRLHGARSPGHFLGDASPPRGRPVSPARARIVAALADGPLPLISVSAKVSAANDIPTWAVQSTIRKLINAGLVTAEGRMPATVISMDDAQRARASESPS